MFGVDMANFQSDLKDITFNLIDVLEVQNQEKFGLAGDDIKGILGELDKFVANEVFPSREKSDMDGVKLVDGKVITSDALKSVHKSFHDNGWFALGFPEAIGGTPVSEAVNVACISIATGANAAWMMYPGLSRAALNVINLKGPQNLKDIFVQKMMTGEWGGTMCLTESGAGSDVGALRTTATPVGDGSFKIKGVKIFISGGDNDLYQNIAHLVLAKTPNAPEGTKGISLFLVPKFLVNADGSLAKSNDVKCTKIEHKMGIHASATCELTFGDNAECIGWLIGQELEGMANMFIMMNEARMYCGVQGESQANLAYLMAHHYARERVQFAGEIVHHPDVKRMLLRMRAQARGMRALTLYTASLFDRGHSDKVAQSMIGFLTPICKSYCSEKGFEVSVDAVQVHGGYGYCSEYGVEQFVRDTKIATIYEGTNGIQAIDLVMRKILKDGGKTLQMVSKEILDFTQKLDDATWSKQKSLILKCLGTAQPIVERFGKLAQTGKMDQILQHCSDFLNFCSNLVVAWRLGVCANKAQSSLAQAGCTQDDQAFYNSKMLDFKIFCQHFLVHNLSLAKTMTDLEEDITNIEI
jgi:alkylation response protein AidB-like acyl-CoA dehydrogenase